MPAAATGTFALYDGDRLPIDALAYYDEVLVDPAKVTDGEITALKQRGRQPLARVVPGAAKGKGADVLAALEKRGFVGYAFDARRPENVTAAEELMLEARRRAPAARIYYWGSPDRLPSVAAAVSGFITDGVFTSGMPQGEDSPPEVLDDMEGVRRLANLVEVRGKYKFPFVVIERVPNHQREQARGIARTLAERGFVPWVLVGGKLLGVGLKEWIPRRILALYDGEEEPDLPYTVVHRLATMPLEHLGFAVDYHDVNSGPLPGGDLSARYAGIVSWFSDDEMAKPRAYEGFLLDQLSRGMKLAILGRPGFAASSDILTRLGLAESARKVIGPGDHQPHRGDGGLRGPAVSPGPRPAGLGQPQRRGAHRAARPGGGSRPPGRHRSVGRDGPRPLRHRSSGSTTGCAGSSILSRSSPGRWTWNRSPRRTSPPRTAGGCCSCTSTATASPAWRRSRARYFSGQIMHARVPGPVPASRPRSRSSRGRPRSAGVYPQLSKDLEPIAKQMFRLPNVEVASHSFSHPFDWVAAAKGLTKLTDSKDPVHMPVPGYKYSAAREVAGSVQYINSAGPSGQADQGVPVERGRPAGGRRAAGDLRQQAGEHERRRLRAAAATTPTLSQIPSLGRWVGGVPAGLRPGPERERLHQRVARARFTASATSSGCSGSPSHPAA